MEKTKLQTTKEIVTDPSLQAPAILTIGTVLWRWLSAASNVDFLLSINEEKFAVLFQFMHSTGWWLLALAGVVWLLFEWPRRKSGGLTPALNSAALVAACSFVAFLFGALVTIRATGSVPNIITAWGGPAGRCTVTFDTTRLLSLPIKIQDSLGLRRGRRHYGQTGRSRHHLQQAVYDCGWWVDDSRALSGHYDTARREVDGECKNIDGLIVKSAAASERHPSVPDMV